MEVLALLANPALTVPLAQIVGQPAHDVYQPSVARPRQKQRKLTPEQVADLVVSYREGASVADLVTQFGIHRTTVLDHLERQDVPRRRMTRALNDGQVAEAVRHYDAGESLVTVAARFNVNGRTIAREFQKAGVETRPQRGRMS